MILPDVNVLVYAYRQDASHHVQSRDLLNSVVQGASQFGMSTLVLSAFVRVVTNTRTNASPTPPDRAFAFCDQILENPLCEVLEPGDRHWAIFRRLCMETGTRGPRNTDAWFAALAIEWGCEWITFDRDFERFPQLKCTILPSRPA